MKTAATLLIIGGIATIICIFALQACMDERFVQFFDTVFIAGIVALSVGGLGLLFFAAAIIKEHFSPLESAPKFKPKLPAPKKEPTPPVKMNEEEKRTWEFFSQLTTPGHWPIS